MRMLGLPGKYGGRGASATGSARSGLGGTATAGEPPAPERGEHTTASRGKRLVWPERPENGMRCMHRTDVEDLPPLRDNPMHNAAPPTAQRDDAGPLRVEEEIEVLTAPLAVVDELAELERLFTDRPTEQPPVRRASVEPADVLCYRSPTVNSKT